MKHVTLLGMTLLLGWAAQGCGNGECEDAGRTYPDGDGWTCSDGCNDCGCNNGEVTSTRAICGSPAGPAAGKHKCRDGDFSHLHGDVWKCSDGCGECTCNDGALSKDASGC